MARRYRWPACSDSAAVRVPPSPSSTPNGTTWSSSVMVADPVHDREKSYRPSVGAVSVPLKTALVTPAFAGMAMVRTVDPVMVYRLRGAAPRTMRTTGVGRTTVCRPADDESLSVKVRPGVFRESAVRADDGIGGSGAGEVAPSANVTSPGLETLAWIASSGEETNGGSTAELPPPPVTGAAASDPMTAMGASAPASRGRRPPEFFSNTIACSATVSATFSWLGEATGVFGRPAGGFSTRW